MHFILWELLQNQYGLHSSGYAAVGIVAAASVGDALRQLGVTGDECESVNDRDLLTGEPMEGREFVWQDRTFRLFPGRTVPSLLALPQQVLPTVEV